MQLWTCSNVLVLGAIQRLAIFFWGLYQDAVMVPKFTDIDYMVFTDAASYVAQGQSPYLRDTYRYTPLLAWMLVPTAGFFNFGKVLFCLGDLYAGYLILKLLRQRYSERESSIYASVWLLNPMVSVISARGSSEGLLGAMIISMCYAVLNKNYTAAGLWAGISIHFKIYPFIYVPTIIWAAGSLSPSKFFNRDRIAFGLATLFSFASLTGVMYAVYGNDYIDHSWLYHATRLDHRHNFSVYATTLYQSLANPSKLEFEKWAFVPQLGLSAALIPLVLARRDQLRTMFIQTWTMVTFNKVCTSQYFIWYLVFLPFFMPSLVAAPRIKWAVLAAWIGTQGLWLRFAYQLEFLGHPVFYPKLFIAGIVFFLANTWCICKLIDWF